MFIVLQLSLGNLAGLLTLWAAEDKPLQGFFLVCVCVLGMLFCMVFIFFINQKQIFRAEPTAPPKTKSLYKVANFW